MSKITFLMYNSVGPLCARTNYPRQAGKQARIVICRARERMGGPRAGWLRQCGLRREDNIHRVSATSPREAGIIIASPKGRLTWVGALVGWAPRSPHFCGREGGGSSNNGVECQNISAASFQAGKLFSKRLQESYTSWLQAHSSQNLIQRKLQ